MNDINIPVKDYIDLLGVNIDKNLQLNSHVKNICTKVNNQVNVISRFRKIVPTAVKCKLYKAFIVPYFRYCSAIWHFCQGLEGYSRDPGFDQNTVWDSGKRKIS